VQGIVLPRSPEARVAPPLVLDAAAGRPQVVGIGLVRHGQAEQGGERAAKEAAQYNTT
jgi:hypothetical protein